MLVIAIGRFGLLDLIAAGNKPNFSRKTGHRLCKKDEHGAKAHGKEPIFAGYYHGLLLSQGLELVNFTGFRGAWPLYSVNAAAATDPQMEAQRLLDGPEFSDSFMHVPWECFCSQRKRTSMLAASGQSPLFSPQSSSVFEIWSSSNVRMEEQSSHIHRMDDG